MIDKAWILLPLLAGCVKKSVYNAEVETFNGRIGSLERTLDAESKTRKNLEVELSSARNRIAEVETELHSRQEELAHRITEAGQLEEEVERVRDALSDAEARQRRANALIRSYEDLVGRFQTLIDAGTLSVKVIDGRMIVHMATDILFAPASAGLSADGRSALREVGAVLGDMDGRAFQVAGHTDNRPIATTRFPSNWHLGAARAIAVVDVLTEAGLEANDISAASYADTQPVASNDSKSGRASNRRIEIALVPDLSDLPGYEELTALGASD